MLAGLGAAASARAAGCALALVDESTLVDRESFDGDAPAPTCARSTDGSTPASRSGSSSPTTRLRMRRLRQRVSPDGDIVRRVHDDVLYRLLARGARGRRPSGPACGPPGGRAVPANEFEAGSVVVVLEAP